MDEINKFTSNSIKRRSRPSHQQKVILYRFMELNPNLKNGKFSPDLTQHTAQKLWTKIGANLNSVPDGARKTWSQWRRVELDTVIIILYRPLFILDVAGL